MCYNSIVSKGSLQYYFYFGGNYYEKRKFGKLQKESSK